MELIFLSWDVDFTFDYIFAEAETKGTRITSACQQDVGWAHFAECQSSVAVAEVHSAFAGMFAHLA